MKNHLVLFAITAIAGCGQGLEPGDSSRMDDVSYLTNAIHAPFVNGEDGFRTLAERKSCPKVPNEAGLSRYDDVVEDNVHYIYTRAQFVSLANSKVAMSKSFIQCRSLDFSGWYSSSNRYFSIGGDQYSFTGKYDFNYHKISNFIFSSTGPYAPQLPLNNSEGSLLRATYTYAGLFGRLSTNSSVSNLILDNPRVTVDQGGSQLVGALAGAINGPNSLASMIDVRNPTIQGLRRVGGAFGRVVQGATVKFVIVKGGTISGGNRVGGMVGEAYMTAQGEKALIENSTAHTTVKGRPWDIVGETDAEKFYYGGFAGRVDQTIIRKSISRSTVDALTNSMPLNSKQIQVGGFTGRITESTVEWSYAQATVSAIAGFVGGFAGSMDVGSALRNSYAKSEISVPYWEFSDASVGGLVGKDRPDGGSGLISNCYSGGSITVTGTVPLVGGLAGVWKALGAGAISNSFSIASVKATTAGLAKRFVGRIDQIQGSNPSGLFHDLSSICLNPVGCMDEYSAGLAGSSEFHVPSSQVFNDWEFAQGKWWPSIKLKSGKIEYVDTPKIYGAGWGGISDNPAPDVVEAEPHQEAPNE